MATPERTGLGAGLGLWLATAVVGVAGAVFTAVAWSDLVPDDAYANAGAAVAGVVYATLGLLIIRRAGNRIGLMLLGEALGLALLCLASAYAIVGVATHPGSLPAPRFAGALAEWVFVPLNAGIAFVLLLFPTGTLPSRRWRVFAALGIAASALHLVAFAVRPRLLALPSPGGRSLTFPNPFGIQSLEGVLSTLRLGTIDGLAQLSVILFAGALAALVVRYRSGSGEQRQQIKWVALAAVGAVTLQAIAVTAAALCRCQTSPVTLIAYLTLAALVLFGIPGALAIAILKYRLYEIDVVINRAVVYGLLAAALTGVYVGVVVGIGALVGSQGGSVLTVVAAGAVALLFQPLRRRAQRVANRLVYGERATPYQVLSDFAENMGGTLRTDEVLERMVAVVGAATGAIRVDVWIRVGRGLRPVGAWPPGSPPADAVPLTDDRDLPALAAATSAVAVRHRDELLGALAVAKPRNEPLSMTEEKLLHDLASQAGLVLRNVRLTEELRAKIEELRASRRRLVEAQDGERRKLERNLHDGAQQQLVALAVQLRLLERFAEDPERVRRATSQLQGALQDAIDDLRDLARGIYPPLLAEKGLGVALEVQARRAAVPIRVESNGIGRYPQEIEAAVYFCALEALQNVAKYAEAHEAVVRLGETDGYLQFEIEDDGRGFDANRTSFGTGLQGMADRLDAIGGTLAVDTEPGRGTRVRGRVPLA